MTLGYMGCVGKVPRSRTLKEGVAMAGTFLLWWTSGLQPIGSCFVVVCLLSMQNPGLERYFSSEVLTQHA